MALHKQVKKRKEYPNNYTLYPNTSDKFLIFYDEASKAYRVTHYSRWGFRGQWSGYGVRNNRPDGSFTLRRNDWTYQKLFSNEIEALNFAKEKAKSRNMLGAVFLLHLKE